MFLYDASIQKLFFEKESKKLKRVVGWLVNLRKKKFCVVIGLLIESED